jgi:hypothetical protein
MAWWSSKSKRTRLLTAVAAAAVAVATAQVGLSVGIAGRHVDGFRVRVTTDKQVYEPGDAVEATLRVCRASLMPTTTDGGGGTHLPVAFRVLDSDDNVVADSSHEVRTLELRTAHWLPGQCRSAHLRWDQHYWNRPGVDPPPGVLGVPVRGEIVPAGQYRFEVTWMSAVEARAFKVEAQRHTQ